MRKTCKYLLVCLVLNILTIEFVLGQSMDSSDHPIIIINTGNAFIPDEPKINANQKLIVH